MPAQVLAHVEPSCQSLFGLWLSPWVYTWSYSEIASVLEMHILVLLIVHHNFLSIPYGASLKSTHPGPQTFCVFTKWQINYVTGKIDKFWLEFKSYF